MLTSIVAGQADCCSVQGGSQKQRLLPGALTGLGAIVLVASELPISQVGAEKDQLAGQVVMQGSKYRFSDPQTASWFLHQEFGGAIFLHCTSFSQLSAEK